MKGVPSCHPSSPPNYQLCGGGLDYVAHDRKNLYSGLLIWCMSKGMRKELISLDALDQDYHTLSGGLAGPQPKIVARLCKAMKCKLPATRSLVHKACQGYLILLDVVLGPNHVVSLAVNCFTKELMLVTKQLEYTMALGPCLG
jgi:hypothetical protein